MARALRNDKETITKPASDLDLNEEEGEKKKVRFEEDSAQEDQYSNENPFAPIGREAETTRCGGLNFRARQPPPPPPGAPPAGATSAPARTPESVRCGLKKAPAGSVEDRCNEVLDAFHADAARGDAERYFAHLAPNFVFLGTDANERWDRANFERYARDRFRTKGWTYVVVARHAVQHAKDVVSFD